MIKITNTVIDTKKYETVLSVSYINFFFNIGPRYCIFLIPLVESSDLTAIIMTKSPTKLRKVKK